MSQPRSSDWFLVIDERSPYFASPAHMSLCNAGCESSLNSQGIDVSGCEKEGAKEASSFRRLFTRPSKAENHSPKRMTALAKMHQEVVQPIERLALLPQLGECIVVGQMQITKSSCVNATVGLATFWLCPMMGIDAATPHLKCILSTCKNNVQPASLLAASSKKALSDQICVIVVW